MAPGALPVYLEIGSKKTFACSLEWPGWCRSGKSEQEALQALVEIAPRYREVAELASKRFPKVIEGSLEIVERIPGSGTTDFGAPGKVPQADREHLDRRTADRLKDLLRASWQFLDQVIAGAPPILRKGPRGGGRDRDEILSHVLGAETAYARTCGLKLQQPQVGDTKAIAEMREAILATIRPTSGEVTLAEKGWPVRYAVRRYAWHALDHAWEIQDKSV